MNPKVILIAEDDESQAEILKDTFEDAGYKVLLATDGAEALDLYHNHKPDIVVLDYDMPVKNGREVLAEIRSYDAQTPVIFLTGQRISKEDSQGCYQLGIEAYFEKPASPVRLVEFIDNQLEKHYGYTQKYCFGNSELDVAAMTLTTCGKEQSLTIKEMNLLLHLLKNVNRVVPADELLQCLWKHPNIYNKPVFNNNIGSLKKKLKIDTSVVIEPKYGIGYCLKVTQ